MRAIGRLATVGLATALLLACGDRSAPGPDQLPVVPQPELTRVEEAVREKLEAERQAFDARLAASQVTAGDYGRLAMLYHAHEQYVPAETGYRNAIRLAPDELRWHYYLGYLLERFPKIPEAKEAYADALAVDPDHLPTLVRLGNLELDETHHERAEELFGRALDLQPECVPALAGLGKVALARREFAEAADLFERALALSPESNAVNYPLGLAYRGLGDNERARGFLEQRGNAMAGVGDTLLAELQALEIGWRFHQDRGNRLAEEEQFEAALESFRKAAEIAPGQAVVHVNIGTTLSRLGREGEARRAFERAVELDPENPKALFNLGTLLAREGDDAKASECYEAVLRIEPDNLAARFNLANALRRLGRFDEAPEHYAAVVAADPSNGAARLGQVLTLVRLERWDEALERLEAARRALPDDRRVAAALARLLATVPVDALRDGARALDMARSLLEQERSLANVETLAMAAAEVGDYPSAVRWQTAAVGAAEKAGQETSLPELRRNLRLYQSETPCRRPWHPDDPVLSPGRRAS